MPFFMLDSRALRVEPNGAKGAGTLSPGQEVEVLEESQGWSKIKRKALTGWVLSSVIGPKPPFPPNPNIDKQEFYRQCWLEGLAAEVAPHYLAAVAMLRSEIKGDSLDDKQFGPYRFMMSEWDAVRNIASFNLTDLRADDINEWEYQCTVYAAMTARDIDALTKGLGRPPSAHELYLAHLIGATAAIASVQPPDEAIDQNLTSAKDSELPEGGLTRPQIMARYTSFLQNPGPPLESVKSGEALDRVAKALQAALGATKDDILAAGTDIIGSTPGFGTIDDAETPGTGGQTGGPVSIPGGTPGAPASGAGGPLGELIASKESGKMGYGAFNRGGAGDAFGKTMNFPKMPLANIVALQSRPRRDPERLFAVGRYQMIPSTMKDAIARLSVNTSQNFDAKLQEFLFRNYLIDVKRPLIKKFITAASPGNTDLFKAQVALALEFASVARPDTGLSHYGGSGHNRALISAAQTSLALTAEHAAYAANRSAGMTPDQAWTALSPGAA
jgi:hypothetical protein